MSVVGIAILLMLAFGAALGSMLLWKVFSMIKSSIDKDKVSISEEDYERLAYAFIQHKKEMQQRVKNLEAIIAEGEQRVDEGHYSQIEQSPDQGSRLTNDLQHKDRG